MARAATAPSGTPQAILKAKSASLSPEQRYRQAIAQFQLSKKPVINRK
jgi:hypothetical protein